jgi:hypothetical protein
MKIRLLVLALCVCIVVLLSGCFIQSVQPFYLTGMMAEVPDLIGEWRLVRAGSDDVTAKYPQPWLFTSTVIRTFEKGIPSTLRVVWFKVDDTLFADLSADERDYDGKLNMWWSMHAIPVHSVCKVQLENGMLSLIPLDGDWLLKKITRQEIALSYVVVGDKGDHYALTSSPQELSAFLKHYRQNPEAFPPGNAHVFQLVKKKP